VQLYSKLGLLTPDEVGFTMNIRSIFQESVMNYIRLQGIDYSQSYACPCGDYVRSVVLDGFNMSIKTGRMTDMQSNWHCPNDLGRATTPRQRVYIKEKCTRKLLRVYVSDGISSIDFGILCHDLPTTLMSLVTRTNVYDDESSSHRADGSIKNLLKCVSKEVAPVLSILPPSVFDHVRRFCSGSPITPEDATELYANAPILSNLVRFSYRRNCRSISGNIRVFCAELLQTVESTIAHASVSEVFEGIELEPDQSGQFYPNRHVYRRVSHYKVNKGNQVCTLMLVARQARTCRTISCIRICSVEEIARRVSLEGVDEEGGG
jgi:hypothetical protein